jgi:hypothetical protein
VRRSGSRDCPTADPRPPAGRPRGRAVPPRPAADVFERIERFEEHGDAKRASIEAAKAAREREDIDKLVTRLEALLGGYLDASKASHDLSEQAEDAFDFYTFEGDFAEHERLHLLAMRALDRANVALEGSAAILHKLAEYPAETLRENERYVKLGRA